MSRFRDGDWSLVDFDPILQRSVWRKVEDGVEHFQTCTQVDDEIDHNKVEMAALAGARWGEGRKVASVPLGLYFEKLAEAQVQKDEKYLSRWLNDSDNAAFRTFHGRV